MFVSAVLIVTLIGACFINAQDANVALKRPCTMSNAELKYTCDKAVDGNLSQDLKDGSCILSNSKTKNFWEVTLDKIYAISSIKIYNRLDSGAKSTKHITVFVGIRDTDKVDSSVKVAQFDDPIADIELIKTDAGTKGNYVRIVQESNVEGEELTLHICEVEVNGHEEP